MKISFETISRLTDRDPHSSLHGQSELLQSAVQHPNDAEQRP